MAEPGHLEATGKIYHFVLQYRCSVLGSRVGGKVGDCGSLKVSVDNLSNGGLIRYRPGWIVFWRISTAEIRE